MCTVDNGSGGHGHARYRQYRFNCFIVLRWSQGGLSARNGAFLDLAHHWARQRKMTWHHVRSRRWGSHRSDCWTKSLSINWLNKACACDRLTFTVCGIGSALYVFQCLSFERITGYVRTELIFREKRLSDCNCATRGLLAGTTEARLKHRAATWGVRSQVTELHAAPANNPPCMYTTRAHGPHTQLPGVEPAGSRWLLRRVINKSRWGGCVWWVILGFGAVCVI